MRSIFRITALLFSLCLLYPCVGRAEDAHLKEIRVVTGGKLKKRDNVRDMRVFVSFKLPDGTLEPISEKSASLNDEIFVESGANLLVKYRGQEAWLNYNALARVGQDEIEMQEGEFYVVGEGGFFNTRKLALLGFSEYYVKVDADGEMTLYVVDGEVRATDKDTGKARRVLHKEAIDESLKEIKLPKVEVERILAWREQLKFPLNWFACMKRWVGSHILTIAAGATAAIIVREVFFSPELDIYIELP